MVTGDRLTLTYERTRTLLLGGGLIVLSAVSLIMYLRRVDTVEVLATLFFIPVFVASLFWGPRGGFVVGALAAVGYAWLRFPAVDAVGIGRFIGVIIGRAAGYLAFGGIGGWAADRLTSSIEKLDEVDPVNDATGLFNAREFVRAISLERSRSQRYGKVFSVAVADFPATAIDGLGKREQEAVLADLGGRIRETIRSVDRASFGRHDDQYALAVVLPETGEEGAKTFIENLKTNLLTLLDSHQLAVAGMGISSTTATFPAEVEALDAVTDHFRELARREFPETSQIG